MTVPTPDEPGQGDASATAMVVGVLGRGLVGPSEPVVRADELGFVRGDGCFETARVVCEAEGRCSIDNLDAHLERLARSTAALGIVVDLTGCRDLVAQVCSAWSRPGEAAVKLMVSRPAEAGGSPTVLATVRAVDPETLRQRTAGISVVTLARGTAREAYANAPWLLGGVKSLSYALNMAAQREAARRGADDAIWVSSDGFVLEAPTSAVVWSAGDELVTTPCGSTGILASTTVAALFAGAAADAVERRTKRRTGYLAANDVAKVDGLWLVSSVRGIAQVVSVDGHELPRDDQRTAALNTCAGF